VKFSQNQAKSGGFLAGFGNKIEKTGKIKEAQGNEGICREKQTKCYIILNNH